MGELVQERRNSVSRDSEFHPLFPTTSLALPPPDTAVAKYCQLLCASLYSSEDAALMIL